MKTTEDYVGRRFGRLVVTKRLPNYKGKNGGQSIRYECLCDCGNITIARKDHLKSGCKVSCGCALYRAKETTEKLEHKIQELNPNLVFIDKPTNYKDRFSVHCKKCGGTFETKRAYLNLRATCPICCNQVIQTGINDISTKAPWMMEYFADTSICYKIGVNNTKKHEMICPICHKKKMMTPQKLHDRGFSCNCCGRSTSYPNRYVRALLRQLPIDNFVCEYAPKWCNEKIFYDNCFDYNGNTYLVEADGEQHYSDRNEWNRNGEVNRKDALKDKLAEEHGCIMIRIDCKHSSASYIRQSIIDSRLSHVFDLSGIDWTKCAKDASTNNVREVCNYYNTVTKRTADIAKHFGVSKTTIINRLHDGANAGLCVFGKGA